MVYTDGAAKQHILAFAAAVNIIANTFKDQATLNGVNYYPAFDPIDKVVELLEKIIKEKDEIIAELRKKIK